MTPPKSSVYERLMAAIGDKYEPVDRDEIRALAEEVRAVAEEMRQERIEYCEVWHNDGLASDHLIREIANDRLGWANRLAPDTPG